MKINPRIFGAFLVGAGLIAFAYFVAPFHKTAPATSDATLGVVTTQAPEREFIAVNDSDGDGIPDWREELQQAEPIRVSLEDATSTGTYIPPETLTGRVAIDMLSDTLKSGSMGQFGPSQETVLKQAAMEFAEAGTDTFYTNDVLTVTQDTSIRALHLYSNKVAAIITADLLPEGTRYELDIVADALDTNNESTLTELDPIIKGYETARNTLLTIPVPKSMTEWHLNLLNSFNALLIDTTAMRQALSDPLYAIVRLKRYQDDALGLRNSILILYNKLYTAGVRWDETDAASKIITTNE